MYKLDRLPSGKLDNSHTIQITSASESPGRTIIVRSWRSNDKNSVVATRNKPFKQFVSLKLGNFPILNASVTCEVEFFNTSGYFVWRKLTTLYEIGDIFPDHKNDGVYSKYLNFVVREGVYKTKFYVESNLEHEAFIYKVDKNSTSGKQRQALGQFMRILKGRTLVVYSPSYDNDVVLPPGRILDLTVEVNTSIQQLEFRWTAPGSDYDEGTPTSYQLFMTKDPSKFYLTKRVKFN